MVIFALIALFVQYWRYIARKRFCFSGPFANNRLRLTIGDQYEYNTKDVDGKKRMAPLQRMWPRLKAAQDSLTHDTPESPVRTGVFRDKEQERRLHKKAQAGWQRDAIRPAQQRGRVFLGGCNANSKP
jgi:hypothetical protein